MNTQLRRFFSRQHGWLPRLSPTRQWVPVLLVLLGALTVAESAQAAPLIRIDTTHRLFDSTKVRIGRTGFDTLVVMNAGTDSLTIDSVVISGATAGLYSVVRVPDTAIDAGHSDYIVVSFSPVTTGAFRDSLTVFSNGGTVGRTMTGVGVSPAIALSTTSVSIDTVRIGEQSCRPVDIQNTGTDTLAITSNRLISPSGQFYYYALVGRDSLIAPGRTGTIGVCFLPSLVGRDTAYIAVKPDIPGDTATRYIMVTATGVIASTLASTPVRTVNAIIGNTTCGFDTLTTTGGTNAVVISNVRVIGADSLAVSLTTPTLPDTLATDTNFVIGYCVTPTHRDTMNASIQVTFKTLGLLKTVTIPLDINGQLVCASASPLTLFTTPTLVGRTDTARVTVTNCGDLPTAYSITMPGGTTAYRLLGSTTTGVVAPGRSTTVNVLYTPIGSVADSAQIIISGDSNVTPITIQLLGSGGTVLLSVRDTVPDVMQGACQDFPVTITNTGTLTWNSGNVAQLIGPNAGDFSVKNFTAFSLAPDSSATVIVTFCPKAIATETATLTFPGATPNVFTQITFIGRGIVNGVADSDPETGLTLESIYPNPARQLTTIRLTRGVADRATVRLLDARGAVVRTVFSGALTGETMDLSLDTKSIASGHYFLAVTTAAGKVILKDLTIVH